MQMPTGSSYHQEEEGFPSFFKVIRYPSSPHLVLPNAFVRRYFKKIPKNPTLVTETQGEHSWQMEFVKKGEDYCFAHGWEKLVKDVQLCIRDIVVFWLIDSLTFKVTFLGANGCEKDFPYDQTTNNDIVGGKCHDHHEVMHDKDPSFEKVFSGKTYKSFLTLPMKFMRAAELQHTKSITLKDHQGRDWRMGILAERYKRSRYSLSAGWTEFRKHHNISEGDVYKFTFHKNQGVLTLTQLMIKGKRPNKQHAPLEEVNWIPTKTPHGGGGKVKIEYDSGPEMEGVARKRRGMLKSFADVKIEDEEMVVPPRERGGCVDVQGSNKVIRSNHVIYF